MPLIDLRQLTVRQLEPLLTEEMQHWREELHWDYRSSVELIKRFLQAHSLAGCAAMEDGQAAGYSFYVLEEQKGLIGGLFVSPRFPQQVLSRRILEETLFAMRAIPRLQRIEAQLMPFGCPMDRPLIEQSFRLFTRQFMLLPLNEARVEPPRPSQGLRLERWDDRFFEPCARLIHLAYADHVDGDINDQYRSESGAMRFLKNIILLPGCGTFQPWASFVLRPVGTDTMIGAILTSEVASGVGHTTQICVMPGYQGRGLGRLLMQASIAALRAQNYSELTLTVTSMNATAVRLYEHLGFRTIKTFAAGVWPA
jgi:ribosomal protein S18 acetylase RimI-like enzyme